LKHGKGREATLTAAWQLYEDDDVWGERTLKRRASSEGKDPYINFDCRRSFSLGIWIFDLHFLFVFAFSIRICIF
jgi:hypothetical protein